MEADGEMDTDFILALAKSVVATGGLGSVPRSDRTNDAEAPLHFYVRGLKDDCLRTACIAQDREAFVAGVVWQASAALSYAIAGHGPGNKLFPAGLGPVLELGCGPGLVSMVTWLRYGNLVVATDKASQHIVERNIEVTKQAAREQNCPANGEIRFEPLLWGQSLPPDISSTQFSTVLGSDLTYDIDTQPSLIETLCAVCALSSCRAVIAHQRRPSRSSVDAENSFVRLARSAGFNVSSPLVLPMPADDVCQVPGLMSQPVVAYELRLST